VQLVERLTDMSREWSTERAGLDRRLLVNERIAEDCLDRIKLSQSAVESYFKASPDVKRFQRSAELVAQLQLQLGTVQEEVRSTAISVHKLEANASTKNEHLELRERVARMEPTVLERLPDYMESTKRVVDLSMSMQSRLDKLDTLTSLQHNDLASMISKVSAVDVLATQLKGLTTVATEEVKRLSSAVAELDAGTRKDINYLRDLTGSISSRVVAVEGKVSVMNKTYAADTVTTNNALAKLTTICEDLQAHDTTTQNTLVQLQWALEAEHRESTDRFAQLKGRLDLLHQTQHLGGGSDAGEGKAIKIQFTTAVDADSGGEADQGPVRREPLVTLAPPPQLKFAAASLPTPAPAPAPAAAPVRKPAADVYQPLAPPAVKPATRGLSAFLTVTSASMSSPEKSAESNASARSWSPVSAPTPQTAAPPADVRSVPVLTEHPDKGDSFVAAREYSYEQERPAAPTASASVDAGESGSLVSDQYSDESPPSPEPAQATTTSIAADEINTSASHIVMQSAFDMSMPSYVSHINSSSDANQSSFDHSYHHTAGPAAGDAGSRASSRLSVGSEESIDQLNSTVAELHKHRDRVLSGEHTPNASWLLSQQRGAAPAVTYDAQAAEEGVSSSEDEHSEADQPHARADNVREPGAASQPEHAVVTGKGTATEEQIRLAELDESSDGSDSDSRSDDDDEFSTGTHDDEVRQVLCLSLCTEAYVSGTISTRMTITTVIAALTQGARRPARPVRTHSSTLPLRAAQDLPFLLCPAWRTAGTPASQPRRAAPRPPRTSPAAACLPAPTRPSPALLRSLWGSRFRR
jgi:hypothetical protein